ncbi:hypothetical protein B005_0631 [Nocardiopsis alba ATCC BAA-2165]|uniref:Uncharacterized protein n=1 Tax=Nocardiopsis alba (strain ATCC BAA-2165 / BE74) TaxID=1205910 RepID=J7L798_NOCAA|nr:hypothetical protein B005_0631 [Nocardiopsis alba ATCC BAA-2165]
MRRPQWHVRLPLVSPYVMGGREAGLRTCRVLLTEARFTAAGLCRNLTGLPRFSPPAVTTVSDGRAGRGTSRLLPATIASGP